MKIAQIMINDLNQDLSVNQGFTLELTENAMKEIVRIGTDPIFGARPLRRAIDQVIRGEIAKIILEGKVQRGQKILIDFQEKFVFNIV
jgi:ATP-dependent Clp protease ATP-binding subunit ClpB